MKEVRTIYSDDSPRPREVGIITIDTPDGPVRGLTYIADFRAEEEYGSGELRRAFTAASDPASFSHRIAALDPGFRPSGNRRQADFVEVGQDYVALNILPGARGQDRQIDQARTHIRTQAPWVREDAQRWRYERMTVAKLHQVAAEREISIPPRTRKAELVDLISAATAVQRPNIHPAWFHYGDVLVLPRGTDDEFGEMVEKMIDAASTGNLIVGGVGRSTFGRGLSLLDGRDLGDTTREQIIDDHLVYLDRMAELEPVKDELTRRGFRWYFLGNPSVLNTGDGTTCVRYWLNGMGGYGRPQPYGWYTVEELLAEKFLDDAASR